VRSASTPIYRFAFLNEMFPLTSPPDPCSPREHATFAD